MTDDRRVVDDFLATRSEDAFRALYRAHAGAVYGLVRRLVSADEADDVTQETWMRAVSGLRRFAWHSSLRTWICGIAVNCCRERWREPPFDGDMPEAAHHADPGAALDLDAALARLPPGYRAAVVLHDLFGYTHAEAAAMLGIDEGTSKSQLARGRRALRGFMAAERPTVAGSHRNLEE